MPTVPPPNLTAAPNPGDLVDDLNDRLQCDDDDHGMSKTTPTTNTPRPLGWHSTDQIETILKISILPTTSTTTTTIIIQINHLTVAMQLNETNDLQMESPLKSNHTSNNHPLNEQTKKIAQSIKSIISNMVINLRQTASYDPTTIANMQTESSDQTSAASDWPDSFMQFLNAISLKQQLQQQQPLQLQSRTSDHETKPTEQQHHIIDLADDASTSTSSQNTLSSLSIDDRDFELTALQLGGDDDNTHRSINKTDSLWLMDFDAIKPEYPSDLNNNDKNKNNRNLMNLMKFLAQKSSSTSHLDRSNLPSIPLRRHKTLPVRFDHITTIDLKQLKSTKIVLLNCNIQQDFDEDEESDLAVSPAAPAPESTSSGQGNPPADQSSGRTSVTESMRSERPVSGVTNQPQAMGPGEDGKYSMLQFALYNFREAIDKYSLQARAPQVSSGDTSTLRGSLKLIESLRNGAGSQTGTTDSKKPGPKKKARNQRVAAESGQAASLLANDWTWRELAEMVKFTSKPLRHSLLKLPSDDLNKRALDCFMAIMQYMGDAPSTGDSPGKHPQNEVDCVYLILMNCHNFPLLRNEVYCQLMKQTTNNRSTSGGDSCLRGWRLFSIVAAYFDCSDSFKPYLIKYLETAAYDKRRAYCSVALLCLQNLRKTFRYGGRKNVPSIEEIAATSAGRNSKRQIYRLPGGTERVINTKSTTVVDDIIHEICANMLDVTDPDKMLEFSLYCIADGDLYTMPLNGSEYILDITTELIKNHQQYFLIFCRSTWHYPLRLDSKLYIEVIFNQIAPDYLEGLFLVLPSLARNRRISGQQQTLHSQGAQLRLKTKLVKEVARIAALLHRASGTDYMPHKDEIKYLLPKPIVSAMRQQQRAMAAAEANGAPISSSASSSGSTNGGRNSTSSEPPLNPAEDLQLQQQQVDTVVTAPEKWLELVQSNWREMSAFDTIDAKAQFLDIVRHWPLFGSSFFAIKLFQRDLIQPTDFILALNKHGIQMLDTLTHEACHKYPYNEVISTRKVRSEDGALYLDLKCGNLMKGTIIRIQTDQAHEISRLIKQYIDIELLQHKQHQQTSSVLNPTDRKESNSEKKESD